MLVVSLSYFSGSAESLVGVKKVPGRQFSGPCRLSLLPLGRPLEKHRTLHYTNFDLILHPQNSQINLQIIFKLFSTKGAVERAT